MGEVILNEKSLNLKNRCNNYSRYFYSINYPTFEEALCMMEMRCLFDKTPSEKYLFSDEYINISRSPFIKEMISIIYEADSLEKILDNIVEDKLAYDDFKVCYIKQENNYDKEYFINIYKVCLSH